MLLFFPLLKKGINIFLSDVIAVVYLVIKKMYAFLKCDKNSNSEKKLRILVYHSILTDQFYRDLDENNVRLDMFKQQMLLLKRSSKKIVSLSDGINGLKDRNLPHDSVSITFDDGLASVYNNALGVLERLNIPATFFIVYKNLSNDEDLFMDWHMIFSIKKKGFEIASHSYSHKRLSGLTDGDLAKETIFAKNKFEEKGISVELFAYPYGFYGDFSDKTEAFIKEAGYKACLTNIMGDNRHGDDLFRLKRTRVSWRDNPLRFKMKINGAYDWIDTFKYLLSHNKA